jgi:hypothetical protein
MDIVWWVAIAIALVVAARVARLVLSFGRRILASGSAWVDARNLFYEINDGRWIMLGLAISRGVVSATDACRLGFVCCTKPGFYEDSVEPWLVEALRGVGLIKDDWTLPDEIKQEREALKADNNGVLPIDDDAMQRIGEVIERLHEVNEEASFQGAKIDWPADIQTVLLHAFIENQLSGASPDFETPEPD